MSCRRASPNISKACINCRSHYDFESAFLEAVRASANLGDEFEPLRARVLAALAAEGMTLP